MPVTNCIYIQESSLQSKPGAQLNRRDVPMTHRTLLMYAIPSHQNIVHPIMLSAIRTELMVHSYGGIPTVQSQTNFSKRKSEGMGCLNTL